MYEFGKNFRNEGMDRTHNPEFTVMEIYVAYKDYLWMMEFTERMLEKVALALHGTTTVQIDGREISFKAPFRRPTMTDAIREKDRLRHHGGRAKSSSAKPANASKSRSTTPWARAS